MKRTKKITALMLAMACIMTMLPSITRAVEETYTPIATEGEMTVIEDFSGTTGMIEYVESTRLTGAAPFLYANEVTTELGTVTPTTLNSDDGKAATKQNTYYGLVSGGAYQLSQVMTKGGGFLSMWTGDSTTNSVVYCNGNPNQPAGDDIGVAGGKMTIFNIYTPYRFTGLDGKNPTALKTVSATLYLNLTDKGEESLGNDPSLAFIYNYIDEGNFDFVYPVNGNNGYYYFRFGAIRTEIVTLGGVQYKKVYKGTNVFGQVQIPKDVVNPTDAKFKTENIGTTSGTKTKTRLDVTVEYQEGGIKFTFSDGTNSYSTTKTDAQLQNANLTDIFSGYVRYHGNATINLASATKQSTPSQSKQIGFMASANDVYVDNISVTYEGKKSAEDLVAEFNTKYEDLLAKEAAQITSADEATVNHALADYERIVAAQPTAEASLAEAKAKLDSFAEALAAGAATGYFTEYGALFAEGFAVSSAEHTILIRKAIAAYGQENEVAQKAIDKMAKDTYGVTQETVPAYYKALTDAYYFNDTVLIHDDFNLYANQEAYNAIWQDVKVADNTVSTSVSQLGTGADEQYITSATQGYIAVPKKGNCAEARLKQFKVTLELDTAILGKAWNYAVVPYYSYDSGAYYSASIATWDGENDYTNSFHYSRNVVSNTFIESRFWNAVIGKGAVTQGVTSTVVMTFNYEYKVSQNPDGEMPKNSQGTSSGLKYSVKNWINVDTHIEVWQNGKMVGENTHNGCIVPSEANKDMTIDPAFTAGVGKPSNCADGIRYTSVSYTYEKGADEVSPEFEAYAKTYGKTTAEVTKADLADIQAAMAIYEAFTSEKLKNAYKTEYADLVELKKVAEFHNSIPTTVTPGTDISAMAAQWAEMGVTNETVAADLTTAMNAYDGFRPTMFSATIRDIDDVTKQRLRFNVHMPTLTASDDYTVVEYGIVMLPFVMLEGQELTKETASVAIDRVEATSLPTAFKGYLINIPYNNNVCNTRIAARAYITYQVGGEQYTIYSTNDKGEPQEAGDTIGVLDGVAYRSIFSIARAMAKDLLTYAASGGTEHGTVTYTEGVAEGTLADAVDNMDAAAILKFVVQNKKIVEAMNNA